MVIFSSRYPPPLRGERRRFFRQSAPLSPFGSIDLAAASVCNNITVAALDADPVENLQHSPISAARAAGVGISSTAASRPANPCVHFPIHTHRVLSCARPGTAFAGVFAAVINTFYYYRTYPSEKNHDFTPFCFSSFSLILISVPALFCAQFPLPLSQAERYHIYRYF